MRTKKALYMLAALVYISGAANARPYSTYESGKLVMRLSTAGDIQAMVCPRTKDIRAFLTAKTGGKTVLRRAHCRHRVVRVISERERDVIIVDDRKAQINEIIIVGDLVGTEVVTVGLEVGYVFRELTR